MDTELQIEKRVKHLVAGLIAYLRENGINTISVGGILRILGVPNDVAKDHDSEYIEIQDEEFELEIPPGTTFH